jgi:hypothetical protein
MLGVVEANKSFAIQKNTSIFINSFMLYIKNQKSIYQYM